MTGESKAISQEKRDENIELGKQEDIKAQQIKEREAIRIADKYKGDFSSNLIRPEFTKEMMQKRNNTKNGVTSKEIIVSPQLMAERRAANDIITAKADEVTARNRASSLKRTEQATSQNAYLLQNLMSSVGATGRSSVKGNQTALDAGKVHDILKSNGYL